MDLQHYLLVCPSCGSIWGRTDELTQENFLDESMELIERAPCPGCKNRSKISTGEAEQPPSDRG